MNNDIYVRDWMKGCPYVQDNYARKNGVKLLEYGIYPSIAQEKYHENVLGELVADDIQEAMFVLTAKMTYQDKDAQHHSFYQNVMDWIKEQDRIHNFPKLNEGKVRSVNARVGQYVSEPNRGEERNEIQIRFTYKRNNV